MAEDISNKTLAFLVCLAILLSIVGIVNVHKNGVTGAPITYLEHEKMRAAQTVLMSIPFKVSVRNEIEVQTYPDTAVPLSFGVGMPGTILVRELDIENEDTVPVDIIIESKGDLAQWITSAKQYTLKPGQQQRIAINLNIPSDAQQGEYEGLMSISTRRMQH